jgi:hypothetical protein
VTNEPECSCIADTNKLLAEQGYNGQILVNLFGPPRATVELVKLTEGKRGKKLPVLIASHCPFCGVRYLSKAEREAKAAA